MTAAIRLLVVDDHGLFRAGVEALLNEQPDMVVVGQAGNIGAAMQQVMQTQPDVVLLDISMPGGGGIQGIRPLGTACPRARLLIVTTHDDPAYVRATMAAGAAGYVHKGVPHRELLAAIRAVHRGGGYLSAGVPDEELAASPQPVRGAPSLSPRERQVLTLLSQGYTYKEVGSRLGISDKTVQTYRARLSEKLGLSSRAELTRYAIDLGLI